MALHGVVWDWVVLRGSPAGDASWLADQHVRDAFECLLVAETADAAVAR